MKKQVFLGILPALLVLSACNGGGQVKEEKYGDLLEDTLAHEEIFSQEEQGLTPRRLLGPNAGGLKFEDPTPETEKEEVGTPYIGVQSVVSGNTVSFRFVAAVQFTSEQRELATATWTRAVSRADGKVYPKDTTDPTPACTTAYKKLSNGESALSIKDFNEAHGGTSYTHFVVYTLRNINLNTYAGNNYYVSAYLSIGGLGGDPLVSKAIAIRFDRGEKYTYVANEGKYYLEGTFSGASTTIEPTAIRTTNNKAEFEYVDFAENDAFVIKEFHETKLYVHGAEECLNYDGDGKIKSCFEAGDNDYIKVKSSMTGNYDLYLSRTENRLYTQDGAPFGVHNGFYVKGSFNSWTVDSNYEMYTVRGNIAVLENVRIEAGQELKVWRYWNNSDQWYGWHDDKVSNNGEFSWADGGNIHCNTAGNYTIFLNSEYKVWINPYQA